MKHYVWLNIETGKFSNSWTEVEHEKYFTEEELETHAKTCPLRKLITYECVSDKEFSFNNKMVIR